MRILRDPNVTPPAGGTPPVEPPIPKTKEDWERLATENPQRWISLTQQRMDQATREKREVQEKLAAEQKKIQNYEAELQNLRRAQQPVQPQEPQPFSRENMPQNKEDWERLSIEDPMLFTDLRYLKNQQDHAFTETRTKQEKDYHDAQIQSVKTMVDRHPEMYVRELDDQGQPKKDEQGKFVFQINPQTGLPQVDLKSEKFKLFEQVFNEDPQGYGQSKFGTRYAMLEMENRLRERVNQQISTTNQPGQNQGTLPDQRGTLPGGITPPVVAKVSFTSDEERSQADKAIRQGTFKSLEDYCRWRDNASKGVTEAGVTPKFG